MTYLNRRNFLGAVAAGSAGLTAVVPSGATASTSRAPSRSGPEFELAEVGLLELQEGMARGQWSAERLVELYLERIAILDRTGPSLRHVLETNPDAPAIAAERDQERRNGRLRGPLHGIPILLKDNIDTADRLTTTAGSLALEGSRAARDAFLVERLRAAGAVVLAKTNMSEWANFRSSRSSSGWSSRGRQGLNPYALDRSPCGSSSGSAAGVSANYAPMAIGTETDGSITCPAAKCGIVGLKPTLGLVSRSGVIPIAHSQDTAGPMAYSVRDAAILLGALTGVDSRDPITRASVPHVASDYTAFLGDGRLEGVRLGVTRARFFGYHRGTDQVAEQALEVLRSLGAELVDPADLPHAREYGSDEEQVLLYEFKEDLNRYLADLDPAAPVHSLADVISFNEREAARVMPYFGQETMLKAQAKGPLSEKPYRDALARCRRLARTDGIDAVLAKHRLDALVAPTGAPAWPIDLVNGDHSLGGAAGPAAVAGYPHLTVPAGFVAGLPVGTSFYGPAWSEPLLIRIGHAFERATRARRPPTFEPTLRFP